MTWLVPAVVGYFVKAVSAASGVHPSRGTSIELSFINQTEKEEEEEMFTFRG